MQNTNFSKGKDHPISRKQKKLVEEEEKAKHAKKNMALLLNKIEDWLMTD